jgi:hypothetical protein
MTKGTRNGLLAWAAIVGPIIAALALLFGSGFCVPPWDMQSRSAAAAQHDTIETNFEKKLGKLQDVQLNVRDNVNLLLGKERIQPVPLPAEETP